MGPIQSVFLAICFYAVQNVLVDKFLRGTSPFVMAGSVAGIVTIFCWLFVLYQRSTSQSVVFPTGGPQAIGALIVCGLLVLCADICYFNAYSTGNASATAITTIAISLPIIVAAIKCLMGDDSPATKEVFAWIFFAAGVVTLSWPTK